MKKKNLFSSVKLLLLGNIVVFALGNAAWAQTSKVLPAGTEIAVRTNDAIDSQTAQEGQTFSATINKAVTDTSGRTLIPKDSPAELAIRSIDTGGTTGSNEMVLDLQSV